MSDKSVGIADRLASDITVRELACVMVATQVTADVVNTLIRECPGLRDEILGRIPIAVERALAALEKETG